MDRIPDRLAERRLPVTGADAGRLAGLLLVGGESRRMGRDKGLLPFRGKPMVLHAAEALAAVCDEVLLVGRSRNPYPWLGLRHLPDRFPGHGPAAGLDAGLQSGEAPLYLLAGCDQPCLQPALLGALAARARLLLEARDAEYDALIPMVGVRLQPLCAVYSARLKGRVEDRLRKGLRRLEGAAPPERTAVFEEDEVRAWDPGLRSFFNINDPAAYKALPASDEDALRS